MECKNKSLYFPKTLAGSIALKQHYLSCLTVVLSMSAILLHSIFQ